MLYIITKKVDTKSPMYLTDYGTYSFFKDRALKFNTREEAQENCNAHNGESIHEVADDE